MMIRCVKGSLAGETFSILPNEKLILGREPKGDGRLLTLSSPTVSRVHCEIGYENHHLIIRDLQSSNGIRVDRRKVDETVLKSSSEIQIGEFTFVVEPEAGDFSRMNPEKTPSGKDSKESAATSPSPFKAKLSQLVERFHRLDFKIRSAVLIIGLGGIVIWGLLSSSISSSRSSLLLQSFDVARSHVKSLGDQNRRELADQAYYRLDCQFLKSTEGVEAAWLLDARGQVICPPGDRNLENDELMDRVLFRAEPTDDCASRILGAGYQTCDLLYPIREWKEEQGQYLIVGVARLRYEPLAAQLIVQKLQSSRWILFILGILVLGLIWWLIQRWIAAAVHQTAEGVHITVTGNAQKIDALEFFAALDPLIAEINKLVAKQNQALSSNQSFERDEASFLQTIIQQVLLLEDRPVMVVDRDNHLIAGTTSLSAVVPVDTERLNAHITDVVGDTHLQGELMALLNDLSMSNEVIDRALSSADHVFQVRGMPLFLKNDYAASIVIF